MPTTLSLQCLLGKHSLLHTKPRRMPHKAFDPETTILRTKQVWISKGPAVLSLTTSRNTAAQNTSWDSCSDVDTIPALRRVGC